MINQENKVLEVNNLETVFTNLRTKEEVKILKNISFELVKGKTVGIVGESGCGKSMTANTIINLLPPNGEIRKGNINLTVDDSKVDLAQLKQYGKEFRFIRGNNISMIFQDPLTALNPVYKISDQIIEVILEHRDITKQEARNIAIELLESLGIEKAENRIDDYPHQFSGGQRQRIMIAIAMANKPDILISDEPTTALDVTIQGQILNLLRDLQEDYNTSNLIITHDLGVVAEMADYVIVMYAGEIVEIAPVQEIFENPKHPYTRSLMKAIPSGNPDEKLYVIEGMVPPINDLPEKGCRFSQRIPWIDKDTHEEDPKMHEVGENHFVRCTCYQHFEFPNEAKDNKLMPKVIEDVTLRVRNVKKIYTPKNGVFKTKGIEVRALDDVSIELKKGSTVGIVGESGSGKSTLAKAIMGLHDVTEGSIEMKFGNEFRDLTKMNKKEQMEFRRKVQMIFQDPYSSFNPTKTIYDSFDEPMIVHKMGTAKERLNIMRRVLDMVNLTESFLYRYPHEFSGGQRQRLSIARALCMSPELLILDEPVSALDLSVQAQVLNYLGEIQRKENLSYIFISHDLGVVKYLCDYIYVIHRGKFVEAGTREDIFNNPQHIYTKRLLAAVPEIDFINKEERIKKRSETNDYFDNNQHEFYDGNLKPYSLKQISDTHFVSIK